MNQPLADIKASFELAAKLVSCDSYHSMTQALLDTLKALPGIVAAVSYEVFQDCTARNPKTSSNKGLLVRRFPLSLSEHCPDEHGDLVRAIILEDTGSVRSLCYGGKSWIVMDVGASIQPRRLILVEGEVDEYTWAMVEGLHDIYTHQVRLLDRKERDALTLLLNRQALDQTIRQILEFYRTYPQEMQARQSWLAIIDVDHFKKINDQHGHLYGDEVLIHFAALMKSEFRYADFLFRFGGEEFVVIVNQLTETDAMKCIERFRGAIANHPFPFSRVTASVGVTLLSPEKAPVVMLAEADQALYQAKSAGRNNTILYRGEALQAASADDIELF